MEGEQAEGHFLERRVEYGKMLGRVLECNEGQMMNIEETQAALEYLHSLTDYSLMRNLRFSEEKFDLSRMRALLTACGEPQRACAVIHVAGTKGKGSTSVLIAAGLQAAGYRVGLYTSPHLLTYGERIQVNRQMISSTELAELVMELRPLAEEIGQITKFELTTAAAFLYFARQAVDVAVIEVGLGGRLDATNVVEPLVSVITSVSYDHMNVLGHSLTAIAGEKAGIIKPGRPVVVSPQKEEALEAIEAIAVQRDAALTLVGREVCFAGRAEQRSLDGQSLYVWHAEQQERMDAFLEGQGNWQPLTLRLALLGEHQVQNAATAYAALCVAAEQGLRVTDAAIADGFAAACWPGRFELLRREPPVVIDSAHNRDSALRLRLALDDYFPARPVVLVFGVSADKDVPGMFAELMPRVSRLVAAQAGTQRAMPVEELVALAHRFGRPAQARLDVAQALALGLHWAEEQNAVLLVTGSIFLVADAWHAWQSRQPILGEE